MSVNSQAARVFWRKVQAFSRSVKPWQAAIYHDVTPDERWDITLVSLRVYGYRDEYIAVMAAAGMDSVDQPLEQIRLTLPNAAQLRQLKFEAGYESRAEFIEDGLPTWSTD